MREWSGILLDELSTVADQLRTELKTPAVIILDGVVGAGKTTFTRAFCKGDSFSPTYSIISETDSILHADFYRIKDPEEIVHLELSLYLEGRDYFFIEWGKEFLEQIYREFPAQTNFYQLTIDICSDTERSFELKTL